MVETGDDVLDGGDEMEEKDNVFITGNEEVEKRNKKDKQLEYLEWCDNLGCTGYKQKIYLIRTNF